MATSKREYMGNACAYIKGLGDTKGKYLKIGNWFQDDNGRISIVVDAMPLPHTPWTGWINLFEKGDGGFSQQPRTSKSDDDLEDDIPF